MKVSRKGNKKKGKENTNRGLVYTYRCAHAHARLVLKHGKLRLAMAKRRGICSKFLLCHTAEWHGFAVTMLWCIRSLNIWDWAHLICLAPKQRSLAQIMEVM